MIKTIDHLQWRIRCPSYYELEGHPQVSIAYLGSALGWHITAPDTMGRPVTRPSPSREHAIALVSRCFDA